MCHFIILGEHTLFAVKEIVSGGREIFFAQENLRLKKPGNL